MSEKIRLNLFHDIMKPKRKQEQPIPIGKPSKMYSPVSKFEVIMNRNRNR